MGVAFSREGIGPVAPRALARVRSVSVVGAKLVGAKQVGAKFVERIFGRQGIEQWDSAFGTLRPRLGLGGRLAAYLVFEPESLSR